MPLRDHFHRPIRGFLGWKSFHAQWASCITQYLNARRLPPGYRAIPQVQLGKTAQIDVATVDYPDERREAPGANGPVATAVWAPPRPTAVVAVDVANLDAIEIEVRNDEDGYRLVAAIELVGPANKDRPTSRQAFAAKCVAYLQQQVSVVVVDIVTERHESLHQELMALLGQNQEPREEDLYANAYRALGGEDESPRLEVWQETLRVGQALPTLPLWIAPHLAVPLDLEASYTATCESLRVP